MNSSYCELHCLSNFSFLKGASHPEELVKCAADLGYSAIALTDECSISGIVRAHTTAKKQGIKLLIGTEITLVDGLKLVILATDLQGYGNLCEFITLGRRSAEKGEYSLSRHDLLSGLPGCICILIPDSQNFEKLLSDGLWLKDLFYNRFWIAVELNLNGSDSKHLSTLIKINSVTNIPLVASGGVLIHQRDRKPVLDVVTSIRLGKPISAMGKKLLPNGERYLRTIKNIYEIYPERIISEASAIASLCNFSLDEISYQYPEEVVPIGETAASYLRKLTEEGLKQRYPGGASDSVRRIIEHELSLISELHYEPYFLTVYDIVKFARDSNILCQGRGSAANSAVCYCLGITEVDPDRMQVLFERFISKERNEPPDIDVDFEHERREEVIQYLYTKYGRERTALTAAMITYRPKSALRDIGKALGFSLDQVDRLTKTISWRDGKKVRPERLIEAGFNPENPLISKLLELAHIIVGFPRHLSQHSGGFVIARGKLSKLVPIENAAMQDRTVIQWDKDDLDALGLIKVDVLALGILSAIKKSLDLVNNFRNKKMTISDIPAEDDQVYEMLCKADTMGVFQIESRAQMSMLPRLKPSCFYDLVIEVAIVRPGPIAGDMVHPYLRRRNGDEEITFPNNAVKAVLARTLGVPIFQEQVMQLSIVTAGFTPGEADQLRRAMAAWKRKGGLEPFRAKLFSGMISRGYDSEFANRIFEQIKGFGEYGFPESHAASFALLVYISAWLKFHEPAAFAAALINSQPMGFYSPSQIIQDVKRHNVEIRAVDVNSSEWDCTIEGSNNNRPAIRLGMRMVKDLSYQAALNIVNERKVKKFDDIEDLYRRGKLDRKDLNALASADALSQIAGHRRTAFWQTLGVEKNTLNSLVGPSREPKQEELFDRPEEIEEVIQDYATTGLTLRQHPIRFLRQHFDGLKFSTARVISKIQQTQLVRTTGIVTCRQSPSTANGTVFVTLEDETGMINVIVWPRLAERQRKQLLTSKLLTVYGKAERQGDVVHVVADYLKDDSELLGELAMKSRNFH